MRAAPQTVISAVARDVVDGLTRRPKSLPPWLFYDDEGSRLFELITELPEYYLTRTERAILETNARDIVTRAGSNLTLIELGAGTASKTRILVEAVLRRQLRLDFYPVDVSASALELAVANINGDYARARVRPLVADYTHGLPQLAGLRGRKLVLYLGSSIGNFEPDAAVAVLASVRSSLAPGDALLLGADLSKSRAVLLPAYDDSQGVTAAFNKNMLARINREFDANFDLDCFRHVAEWNPAQHRMEMYLESAYAQTVNVAALDLRVDFEAGERIHTENSYKYTRAMIGSIVASGGFQLEFTWTDPRRWFALHLARVPKR